MKKIMKLLTAGVAGLSFAAVVPSFSAQAKTSALSGYYVNQAQKLVIHKSGKYLLVGDYQQVPNGRVKTYKIVSEHQKGNKVTLKYQKMRWRYAHNFQEAAVSHHFLAKKKRTSVMTVTSSTLKVRMSRDKRVRGLQPNKAKAGQTLTFKAQTTNPVASWVTAFETKHLTDRNMALKAYADAQAAKGLAVVQPALSDTQLQDMIKQAIAHDVSLVEKPYLGQAMPEHVHM
ncbi:hypothetical protein MUDAN_DOGOELCO_01978 [Lactiplantibacillus mudanjiangensis]|uniref:hypothetical protein n=1 Tax=Lactiplantibacillus mudanjiangensis TaxID=1296538 RepID=UPI0010156DBE|nr:hypothetical protein [Lactiplantibacillus mudanjiangensis]VDG32718.1 hypothetical protein MUDAN_DOGOELCO_01978 [Lactiplantibacillus mudanjiangensis]